MITVKELIKALLDCDMADEVYVNVYDGTSNYYAIDGLENFLDYKRKPTLAICGEKINVN